MLVVVTIARVIQLKLFMETQKIIIQILNLNK
jgi:hypothetical protein